jgi:hypothetical protein
LSEPRDSFYKLPMLRSLTRASSTLCAGLAAGMLAAVPAQAQQRAPAPEWAEPPRPTGAWSAPPRSRSREGAASGVESGTWYLTSAAYGIGLGVWLDAELELQDPALVLIPPSLLGVAMPLGAYIANHPTLPRGLPAAITAGLVIGAGEGLGVAGVQMVTADDPWGFTGLSRALALGSTLGGIGGYAVGVLQEPSPNISVFATSGVVWGSLIGAAVGLGASDAEAGFEQTDEWMGRGALIGFNVGLASTMALSTVFVPSMDQLSWMWLGGGIGALASLPVYLFYLGDDGPPAKRGLLFTATATTLGIVAGGVFGPQVGGLGLMRSESEFARVDYIAPFSLRGGLGLRVGGTLF